MYPIIVYDRVQRRVYVWQVRIHHGLIGVGLVIAGAALIAHDWRDRRVWFYLRAAEISEMAGRGLTLGGDK